VTKTEIQFTYLSLYICDSNSLQAAPSSLPLRDAEIRTRVLHSAVYYITLQALLNNPSSVTVTPDGVLFIADMGNLRVHSVLSTLPKAVGRHYE